MPALLAALIALALIVPAEGRHKNRTACVPTYEPGVGPGQFCAAPPHRKRR